MTLRARILLLIAGTVGALTALLLVALNLLAAREINTVMRREAQATEAMLQHLLTERAERLTVACRLTASQPTILGYAFATKDETSQKALRHWETMTDLAEAARSTAGADAALITDHRGEALGDTGAAREEREDCAQMPPVAAALAGREWSGVVIRRERLMLAVAVPITDPVSGYVRGTFTAFTEIGDKLAADLRAALGERGSEVAFLHGRRVVGASRALPAAMPTVERRIPLLVTVPGAGRYFAMYSPLPLSARARDATGFVTLHDYEDALAFGRRIGLVLALLSGVTLTAALLIGVVAARGITRPLDGIVAAAQTLREGRFPAPFPDAVRRGDEIGLLQEVFNEMSDSLRASQERLLSLIDTDALTGLDNHRRFRERLDQETLRCEASGEPLSLLLIDLDHFKQFNARCGHASGDEALRRLAAFLEERIPPVAIAARYGGEEFALLLPRHEAVDAERLAESLRMAYEETEAAAGTGLSVSIGCAALGPQVRESEALVLAAELALSQAKLLGRARTCRFDSVPGAQDSGGDPYHLHRFLHDGSLATIQALAAAVDAKDPYTQGHSSRVGDLAARLAEHLGLSPEEAELVHITGTLHDVGKIGVPDAILQKPGRLTADERALMETHSVLGELIVRKAPQLAATLAGVRHHHERWDGHGYPDGLAGEAIPRIARILAVADTFDAMTSDRPYREGLSEGTALGEIAACAGAQFDPVIAAAFVEMLRREEKTADDSRSSLSLVA